MLTPDRGDSDHFHDECGVFGVYGHPDAAALTALGLHALQHRGQEAAGIACRRQDSRIGFIRTCSVTDGKIRRSW